MAKDLRKEKDLRGGKVLGGKGGTDLNRERGGKDLGEEREKNRERGDKILGRKREKLSGGGGGKGWEGFQPGKGGKRS